MPKNFESGFIHFFIAAAVLLLITAIAGTLYYRSHGQLPFIEEDSNITLNLYPNCFLPDQDICKFINNWSTLKTYSVKSVSLGGSTKNTLWLDYADGSYHLVLDEGDQQTANSIVKGSELYVKNLQSNKWDKQPLESGTKIQDIFNFKYSNDETLVYQALGKEKCGSAECFKYQVIDPSKGDTKEFIWFDDKRYRLRKQQVQTKSQTTESDFSYRTVIITPPLF